MLATESNGTPTFYEPKQCQRSSLRHVNVSQRAALRFGKSENLLRRVNLTWAPVAVAVLQYSVDGQ